jgi:hypothetical protein
VIDGEKAAGRHIATTMLAKREMKRGPAGPLRSQRWEAPVVATIQAVVFWIMLALTPSMVLVAVLLCRERTGLSNNEISELRDPYSSQKLEFDDQPPYPSIQ